MPLAIIPELPSFTAKDGPRDPSIIFGANALHLKMENAKVIFNPLFVPLKSNLDNAAIYIAENRLYIKENSLIIAVDYPSILIHAIARENEEEGTPAMVYCQLDAVDAIVQKVKQMDEKGNEIQEEDDEEECPIFEMKLIPADAASGMSIHHHSFSHTDLLTSFFKTS